MVARTTLPTWVSRVSGGVSAAIVPASLAPSDDNHEAAAPTTAVARTTTSHAAVRRDDGLRPDATTVASVDVSEAGSNATGTVASDAVDGTSCDGRSTGTFWSAASWTTR